jgi:transposase
MGAKASSKPLSADAQALRTKLRAMVAEGRAEEMIDAVTELFGSMTTENTALKNRLHMALRRLFGKRSERVSTQQLQLMLALAGQSAEALSKDSNDTPPDETTSSDDDKNGDEPTVPPAPPPPPLDKKKGKSGRKPIPDTLEREVREIAVPLAQRACSLCGQERVKCGHETSEMLAFVPAKIIVVEERREKLICRPCESIVTAPLGDRMLEGGRPSAGLLAYILVSKYGDGLPLYRISEIFLRMGLTVSSSTMSDWVAAAAMIIEPIALRIAQRVLASAVINADDTPLPVLDRDDPRGIKKGRIWAYVGDRSLVAYDYTPNWEATGPCEFLEGFDGFLQGDGYAGFEKIKTSTLIGCNMHSRRKFEAAMEAGDPRAAFAMALYRKIYDLERTFEDDALSADARRERRLEKTKPLFDQLKTWVDETHPTLAPSSLLAKATTYARNQWDLLTGFFIDGRLEIDNGEVERRLRRVTMGRDAYLFAGSDKGAERAATAYTVIVSARMQGHDSWHYLVDVMTQLQRGWPVSRIDELLPDRWTKKEAEQRHAEQGPGTVAR